MSEPILFRCRGFRWPFWLCVFLLLNFSMTIMFLTFYLGLPPFVSVAVLLLSMVFGIGILGAQMEYRLTQDGIVQELWPLKWSLIKMSQASRLFKWEEIKSYRSGEDLSRGLQRYHYLYISVKKFPYQLRLSDHQASKEQLAVFEQAFESVIATGVLEDKRVLDQPAMTLSHDATADKLAHSPSRSTVLGDTRPVLPVRRHPDFYHSRRAHIVFWFFVVLFAVIGYQMVVTRNSNLTNYWRIGMVVLPGMSYFAWRLYGRQRRD